MGGTIISMADLHLGNIRTDYKSIKEILIKFRNARKPLEENKRMIIVVGDLIDSVNMYKLQALMHLPKSMDAQRFLLLWLDDLIPDDMEKILVVGNHERNHQSVNLVELLKMLGWKIYNLYYCTDVDVGYPCPRRKKRICFMHTTHKAFSGSKFVGRTPGMQYFDYTVAKNLNADIFVTAHAHKMFNMVVYDGIKFIMLPAFDYDTNKSAATLGYTPCAWVYFPSDDKERIEYVKRDIDYILKIEEENFKLLAEITIDYYSKYRKMIYG